MNKKQLMKPFQDLKQEIDKLKKKQLMRGLFTKFNAEKNALEKRIEKTVVEEVKKAKKFMNDQKKELNKIQKKVESALKKKKTGTKKTASKSAFKASKKAVVRSTKRKASK